jgi:hypothetical protein
MQNSVDIHKAFTIFGYIVYCSNLYKVYAEN